MNFEFADLPNPPKPRAQSGDYDKLFAALQSRPGDWVRITPVGRTPEQQATLILNSAASRRVKVQTTKRDGSIYVRLPKPQTTGVDDEDPRSLLLRLAMGEDV